jgi:hypothetical protein
VITSDLLPGEPLDAVTGLKFASDVFEMAVNFIAGHLFFLTGISVFEVLSPLLQCCIIFPYTTDE